MIIICRTCSTEYEDYSDYIDKDRDPDARTTIGFSNEAVCPTCGDSNDGLSYDDARYFEGLSDVN